MTRAIPPVRRLLMDAKALIARPENWCKGTYATSAKDNEVDVFGRSACRFCAEGAIWRANHERHQTKFVDADEPTAAIDMLNFWSPVLGDAVGYQDLLTTTHPMIMRLFNKAIARAKEQGI